jgi:peptidoglycan-associated lipoprotein
MKQARSICWLFGIFLMMAVFSLSCGKRPISSESAMPSAASETSGEMAAGEGQDLQAQEAFEEESLKDETLAEEMAEERKQIEKEMFVNEDIYFEFDSAKLSPEAQTILQKKAQWLKNNPQTAVTIEGHCDERGTNEYNLALGDRRAFAAKAYLLDLGISASRLSTVSYGEERPIEAASNESAWAKNRRAHFVIEE